MTKVPLTSAETIEAKQKAVEGLKRYIRMCHALDIDVDSFFVDIENQKLREKTKLRILEAVIYGCFFIMISMIVAEVYCVEHGLNTVIPLNTFTYIIGVVTFSVVGLYFKINKTDKPFMIKTLPVSKSEQSEPTSIVDVEFTLPPVPLEELISDNEKLNPRRD